MDNVVNALYHLPIFGADDTLSGSRLKSKPIRTHWGGVQLYSIGDVGLGGISQCSPSPAECGE